MALTDKLTAIADAIRGKTGKSDGLTLDAMPGEIEGIQSGGDTSFEDGIITRTLTTYSNDRVTTVGDGAFSNNRALTEVSLPNITTIGSSAFSGCTALTEVEFPNITTIGGSAFRGSGIKTFYLPKLTKFEDSVFAGSSIKIITNEMCPMVTGTNGNYSFQNCKSLKYFQHNMVFIYQSRSFYGCSALEKVDIHATGLTYHAFSGCLLETLILRRTDGICELGNTNAIADSALVNGTGYVYVPAALLEEYKVATNWSSLNPDQFRAIEDYPEICEVGV